MASSVLHITSSLAILLWFLLITSGSTQEPELDCTPSIRASRNTVWKSPESQTLKINCTVLIESHCWKNLSVFWCKLGDGDHCRPLNHSTHTGTEWRDISGEERMFFLIFQSLSVEDAGLYRCRSDAPVSTSGHTINVTIAASDKEPEVLSNENKTTGHLNNSSKTGSSEMEHLLPYVYICSGILGTVLIVLVVTLFIIRCRGLKHTRKEKIADRQSSASQMPQFSPVHDSLARGNTHSLPGQLTPPSACIYDNAPIRASSQRDGPSRRHPGNHAAKPGQSRDRCKVEVEEEENPLVYASLNHKAMARGQVRVSHPEETSEYAAIRVS